MDNLLLNGVLLLLVAAAVLTVVTDRLLTAVFYSGVLSLMASFCYLLLGAPDVALAEAVIGSTLSTIIYLVTLKKYRIFTIAVLPGMDENRMKRVLSLIGRVLRGREIEPHVMQTSGPVHDAFARADCDLVVEQRGEQIVVHAEENSKYAYFLEEEARIAGVEIQLVDSLQDRICEK